MRKCLQEKPECAEFILKIILPQIKGLKIKEIKPEYEIDNFIRRSVCLDAFVVDEEGTLYDIEIQRADKGASPKRARYHGSMMDIDFLNKGDEFDKLPVRYVIFISENGYKCNQKPLRNFSTCAEDDGEAFGDEVKYIYVNGKNKDDTELGKLMSDLGNPNPDTMNYQILSDIVGSFKKSKKGRDNIMTVTEKIYNAGLEEGHNEGKLQTLFELLKDGILTIEIAAKKANMTIEDFNNQMKLAGYSD
jgi:hypothetical protein